MGGGDDVLIRGVEGTMGEMGIKEVDTLFWSLGLN